MGAATITPVAIIGMACRLPGGIDSPQSLWEALLRGDDFVGEIPADRWDADVYYDPEPGVPGRSVTRWGAFLDDVGGFDSDFFGMTEREATAIDPQHRLLLEASWDAIEHAGLDPAKLAQSQTGVFVGLTHGDYELLSADCGAAEGPYGFTGTCHSFASGRVSYALGLHGPAVTMDTACSSGLMAVHQACASLDDGESDLALAGGVVVMLEPRKCVAGSLQGMLSPTGRCRAFDVAADGFVSGEGCVVLLLKRLPDAVRDGDRILAVVRGTAANQDGRTVNIAAPSEQAQVAVYQKALAAAGVDPSTVGLVEAHGTGTPIGDPVEFASLAAVYGIEGPCALASVKTNFGHMQSTSGALGMMKAILALQHGLVPQNLHFTRLPDQLAEIKTELFVPQANTRWPTNGHHPRRAAVSSYGMSGTNVHAILEQAPVQAPEQAPAQAPEETAPEADGPLLFPVSATSAEQLRVTAARLADWVEEHGSGTKRAGLRDLGYTLSRRRAHRPVRTIVTASSFGELSTGLREVANNDIQYQPAVGQDDRGPVWVFSGQGSQWPRMGAELLANEPLFAATIAAMEPVIANESGFSVTEAMSAPETVTGIDRVQPTIFAMQVALAATMKSYGVRPGAVIGHSLGEAAAAVVAGALSLDDGLRVICRRSRLMSRIAGSGAMASVELPGQQVLSELSIRGVSDVVLSVVASPTSTVVGGATQTIRDLVVAWQEQDIMAREVAVDVASHSPQVDPILDELVEVLADLEPKAPEVPYYSATLWNPRERPSFTGEYWAENLRYTVRFAAAVQAALKDGFRVFGELAPHPLLTYAVEQNASSLDMPIAALAAMRRRELGAPPACGGELPFGLRGFVADVHSAGAVVDFSVQYPSGRLVDAPLPTWTHRRLLLSRESVDHVHGASVQAVHPLLGAHVHLLEEPERHVWQGGVGIGAHPWLGDHQIHSVAALPGTAYCEMALAAARATLGEESEVRDLKFEQTLLLDDETLASSAATVSAPGVLEFAVETHEEGERVRRASAVLHAVKDLQQPAAHDIDALIVSHPLRMDGAELRKAFDGVGIQYGAAFSGLAAALVADGTDAHITTVLAEVALPGAIRSQQSAYATHPALLDACFQSVIVAPEVQKAGAGGLLMPVGVRRLRNYHSTRNAQYCLTRVKASRAGECEADLEVLDRSGRVLLTVEGLRLAAGASEHENADRVLNERLFTIEWEPRELPEVSQIEPGSWLLLSASGDDPLTGQLGEALNSDGAQCTIVPLPLGQLGSRDTATLRSLLSGEGLSGSNGHGPLKGLTGVVVVTAPPAAGTAEVRAELRELRRGRDYVSHLVGIARELAELPGEVPRLFVVTRNAASVRASDLANLEQAGLRGLMRVIDSEYPHLGATQIDVDDDTDPRQVSRQLQSGSDEDETAWRNGEWYSARLRPGPLRPAERRTTVVEHERDGARLQIRTPGDLESLEFTSFERVAPGPGEIEVAVTASTINFADVLVAFGRYPTFEGFQQRLGGDFAGVVTAVGPDVTEHKVGDHVGGMSRNGCWGTFVIADAQHAVTIPPEVPLEEAAAVPTASATAWYSLHDLARISPTDKVLIHSATGGVGQAAIAIARAAGCEIFATAGSPERRQLLHDMGIEHVYHSRSTDFADEIRRDTGGYGVDVVLNSLTGAAQRAGIELLAFGGRFVEIGKRDIYRDTRLGLFPFRKNLSLYAVDLALLTYSHPEIIRRLLTTVYQRTADGVLPMPQTTHYPIHDAAPAVRLVAGAGHVGKVVLDVPHTGSSVAVVPPGQVRAFRADGSYIITGGIGGLGLFLAGEMAAAGCGRIVLNSRSAPNEQAQQAIERLRATGADIQVECGDIAEPATAERLVACATASGLPVRGVLHGAAVVEDATLTNVTDELIDRCWAPKAYGAWNLHEALQEGQAAQPLDWFCSFSAAAALVGSPGQGAYAAANSWLNAFAHWRRVQGLPSTAIAWGAWAEVGRATAMAEETGAAIAPAEGARAFETLLRYGRAYSCYAPIMGTPWLDAFAQRSRFAEAFQSMAQIKTDKGKFLAELKSLPRDEWPSTIRRLVSDQISLLLRRTIDPDRPLSDYGLDSLGNLELRTRIETETGVRISPTKITTVRDLAEHLCGELANVEAAPAVP